MKSKDYCGVAQSRDSTKKAGKEAGKAIQHTFLEEWRLSSEENSRREGMATY